MATLYEFHNTGDNGESFIQADTQYWAQTFTPSTSHTITSVKLKLLKRNVPGTITVGIRDTSGGKPTGGNLTSGTLDATTLDTTPGSFKEITFGTGTDLTSGIKYAIVLSCTGNNPGTPDDIAWRVKSAGSYAGGDKRFSSNSGVTWGDAVGSEDFMFEEWGDIIGGSTVTTEECTNTIATSTTGWGHVTVVGDGAPTQHGHVWSTSQNPTTSDSKTELGAKPQTGNFTSDITGLTPGTTYYVKAYAVNTAGTNYGAEVNITTLTTIRRAHIWSEGSEFHYFDEAGAERVLQGHETASDKDIWPWLDPFS